MFRAAVLILALAAPAAFAAEPSWIEESNKNAQILLEVMARYNAEAAATLSGSTKSKARSSVRPTIR